ncbi:hypothetical protein DBT_2297 [Dissulfuribacter thermophilus]|uniref:Prepilin-type N-terminal cleavage/methylation domain-containing protein n=1 Tax=Dissulfuribacter thermophilus TaxID=1156395 RepID=A0A1B9F2Y9_9BACT|nr:prepilin-type N-terminal cleavage/methylation domain-containing protein [Dissulfuribacter thermophilus]OCC14308.1 hypothetical protein DBT_2297 [Dissulfuribacter thermophilus]
MARVALQNNISILATDQGGFSLVKAKANTEDEPFSGYLPIHNSTGGFTLVEALIAILILSIMLLGLIPAFIRAYNINYELASRDTAIDIAQEVLEQARSSGYSSVTSGIQTIYRRIKKTTIPYTVNTTVTDLFDGDLKNVKVVVYWTIKGEQKSYSLTTVVGDINE